MNNFDLKKYLAEGKLNEENYKTLRDFGPDLVSRLKGLGIDAKLFKGQMNVPQNAKDAIIKNPNLAGISYFEKGTNERIEIIVNKDKFDDLKSIKTFFDSLEGNIKRGPIVLSNEIGLLSYETNEGKLNEENYTPGSGWTKDFDYDGMLNLALTLDASSPMDLLLKVSDDLEDVNYHRENSYLTDAIDAIKDGDRAEAKIAINKFRKEINKTLNEGIFDRAKAKIKGAATGIKTAVGNVAAAAKGNKDAIKDTALEVGMTKLKVKATTLNKDLDKVISDIDKLFPEKKLEKNPKLANIIDQYKISLENAKTQNAKIGKIEMKESEITETPLNKTKMKKSELKEMIKMALSEDARTDAEQEGYKDGFDDAKDDIEAKLKDMKVSEGDNYYEDSMDKAEATEVFTDAELDMASVMLMAMFDKLGLENNVEKSDALVKYINSWFETNDLVSEAEEVDVEDNEKVDVDIEKDVEVDDKSVESDIEVKGSMPGEDADEIAVQSLLMKAQEEAEKLGDEKLTDQIGNTITYFTRAHVATVDEAEEMDEIAALPGSTGVEDVNVDDPAEDAMVGLTERLRWQRIAGIAEDNGLYSK